MSAAAGPASPSVARNSSARRPQQAQHSERPTRSQSTTTRPSGHPQHSQQSQHSPHLKDVARRDYEQSNVAAYSPSRHSESREGPPQRTESSRRHSRYASDASTTSAMPTNGVTTELARGQPVPVTKRRTTITAPSTGTWALGKTIGAGSMGKVKLAKHNESGEQVRAVNHFDGKAHMLIQPRWRSRLCLDCPRTSTRVPPTVKEPTTPRKFELHERPPLSVCSTTPTFVVCETWYGQTTTGICSSSLSMEDKCSTTSSPMDA